MLEVIGMLLLNPLTIFIVFIFILLMIIKNIPRFIKWVIDKIRTRH